MVYGLLLELILLAVMMRSGPTDASRIEEVLRQHAGGKAEN
jgi:hypothetical protein